MRSDYVIGCSWGKGATPHEEIELTSEYKQQQDRPQWLLFSLHWSAWGAPSYFLAVLGSGFPRDSGTSVGMSYSASCVEGQWLKLAPWLQ